MIAYNPEGLDNRYARSEAEEAESENIISAEEHSAIRIAFPDPFYKAPFFARLGFFVLTLICLSFSGGIFFALTEFGSGLGSTGFIIQMFLMGGCCIVALEWLIRNKKHLASGVDDALLYSAFGLTTGACYAISFNMPPVLLSLIFLIAASVCVARYADRLLGLVAFFSLLALVFFIGLKSGAVGKALMPFILMSLCTAVYFSVVAYSKKNFLRHYRPVLTVLKIASLVCLYAAGNYFVVREANHAMSGDSTSPSAEIPIAWLFWIFTAALPLYYIYLGVKNKNRILLIAGLILVAGTAFTVRYYHSFMPAEWAMLIGGSLLLVIALGCMRLLKTPWKGITAVRTGKDPLAGFAQIEALVIDESLSPAAVTAAPQVVFGGGSGGGGGAGGQF